MPQTEGLHAMTLSSPMKIIVGALTAVVTAFPFLFVAYMLLFVVRGGYFRSPQLEGPQALNTYVVAAFASSCLISILIYALTAFYIAHAIRNTSAPDVLRTALLLAIFIVPYLGMPAYYILYLLIPQPPSWAVKHTPHAP